MKRSTGYNVLKGAANKVAQKEQAATVSPITKKSTDKSTDKSKDKSTDKGKKS